MSGLERTKIWTWTHDSLVNARKSGHGRSKTLTLERTNLFWSARWPGKKRMKVWSYAFGLGWSANIWLWRHEKHTIVWTYLLSVWDGLDIGTIRLGRTGQNHFSSGAVWTYRAWVWHLSLGNFLSAAQVGCTKWSWVCSSPCDLKIIINNLKSVAVKS